MLSGKGPETGPYIVRNSDGCPRRVLGRHTKERLRNDPWGKQEKEQ
jgi:hypothetical protein